MNLFKGPKSIQSISLSIFLLTLTAAVITFSARSIIKDRQSKQLASAMVAMTNSMQDIGNSVESASAYFRSQNNVLLWTMSPQDSARINFQIYDSTLKILFNCLDKIKMDMILLSP